MTTTTEISRTNGHGLSVAMPTPADFSERAAQAVDDVIGKGDLSKMTPGERVNYYRRVCESLGLNPLTKPFEYVNLGGLKLYATKGCTDQLRDIKKVSIPKDRMTKEYDPQTGLYTVEATAVLPDGREDTDIGVVNLKGLTGEALANATMKAMTKAKRRVTLSVCGLGWLDETEIGSIPDAKTVQVDFETGDILEDPSARSAASRAERTLPQQRGEQPRPEILPEHPRDTVIAMLTEMPVDQRVAWRERFEQKWGSANPKALSEINAEIARDAIYYKEWPFEAEFQAGKSAEAARSEPDPFDDKNGFKDGQPALMEADAAAPAQKGHGDS